MKNKEPIVIDVRELTKFYNSHPAVDHLSFLVREGTIFGLLGPNGAGKSSVIKMLTTLLPPSLGTALINGYDIVKNPNMVRKQIGYVPQMLSADGDLTAYENLLLSTKLYGLNYKTRQQRISEVLEFLGLTPFRDQLVKEYSGGMIRRLEIGQALLHNPKVLFLDEPTVGLDPSARKTLWKHIQDWRSQFKTTILMTTHDMDEADKLCDCVAFMYLGKIVTMSSPEKLKSEISSNATLDDVFIHYTGTSIKEGDDYSHAKERRRSISHLE